MKLTRRSFLMNGGAVLLASGSVRAVAQDSDSSLLAFADMEVGQFSAYATPSNRALIPLAELYNPVSLVQSPDGAANKVAKVYLNRTSSPKSSYRSEFGPRGYAASDGHTINFQWRRTYWLGWSIYIPSDWAENSTGGEVLAQIHNYPSDWNNSNNPIVAFYVNEPGRPVGYWSIVNNYIVDAEVPSTTSGWSLAKPRRAFVDQSQTFDKGVWTDWVVEYRPDWQPIEQGGIGVTRIWKNGRLVRDYRGPNAYNETKGPYFQLGCYKWDWRSSAFVDNIVERTYYFDEVRVSRPDQGSYQLVAPRRVARPLPPSTFTVT